MLDPVLRDKEVNLVDWYVWKEYCFLHGDRDFEEIYDKKIKYWIIGHAHPAITLREGTKAEKYKCFLVGSYSGKNVIVLPSFFPATEGSDPRDDGMNLAWPFNLGSFEVKVIGENLDVLDFGPLRRI